MSRNSSAPDSGGACRLAPASSPGARHDLVERLVAQARLLPAHQQPGELRRRHEGARAEHARRDDLAERDRVVGRQHRADGHHAHAGQRDDGAVAVGGARHQLAGVQRVVGDGLRQALPLAAAPRLGAERLDGVEAVHRLEQVRRALRALLRRLGHLARQRALHRGGQQQHQHDARQRHHHQPAADEGDEGQVEQHERQVAEQRQRGGGEELAQRLEVAHRAGEHAARGRPVGGAHAQALRVDLGRQRDVDAPRRRLQQVAAQQPHRGLEADDEHGGHGQHRQAVEGAVRHHAVVHRHREERHQRARAG